MYKTYSFPLPEAVLNQALVYDNDCNVMSFEYWLWKKINIIINMLVIIKFYHFGLCQSLVDEQTFYITVLGP